MNTGKFWIRKDRESHFLTGVIIACSVGAFVSSYWHFTDRITVRQNIQIRKTEPTKFRQVKLREVQYTPVKLRAGATQYYRLDDDSRPSVPKLGEDDEE